MILACTAPLIIVYQSIPLVWLYLLRRHRARLKPPTKDKSRAYEERAKDSHVQHLRFLFGDYRCGMYYYEVVEMYRRIFLLGVLPFVPTPIIRAGFGLLFSVCFAMLFRELVPYHRLESNTLAIAGQQQVMLT